MRALIATHYIPKFPASGAPTRDFCLAQEMAKHHEVTFLLPDYGEESRAQADPLRSFCNVMFFGSKHQRRGSKAMRFIDSASRRLRIATSSSLTRQDPALVQALAPLVPALTAKLAKIEWQEFDLLQIEHSQLGIATDGLQIDAPTILDWHNVNSVIAARHSSTVTGFGPRLAARHELQRLQVFEVKMAKKYGRSLAVSEEDAAAIRMLYDKADVSIVPNGVNCQYFQNPEPQHFEWAALVFTGAMDYEPNEEAILYFCENVLPIIQVKVPEVKLYVVGQRPTATVKELELRYPGFVHVTGFVHDVRPFLRQAAICVAPLLNGGGTRLKILEALAMQKPVVATSVGSEGLRLKSGRELVIADSPEEIATAIVSLLEDRNKAIRIAEQGYRTVRSHYDWAQVALKLKEAWELVTPPRV